MANDQLATAAPMASDRSNNQIRLISQFLSVSEFQLLGNAARLFRPFAMLSQFSKLSPKTGPRFDLEQMFSDAVGVSPATYFPLVFACMSKYQNLSVADFYKSPDSFALRRDWFSQTDNRMG